MVECESIVVELVAAAEPIAESAPAHGVLRGRCAGGNAADWN